MIDIVMDPRKQNAVGRLGENEHSRLIFDISEMQAMYPQAYYSMLCQRPGDTEAYPVADTHLDISGSNLYWTLTSTELAHSGVGKCELVVSYGSVIAKTVVYLMFIDEALDDSGEIPEPWESWTEEVTEIVDGAETHALKAEGFAVGEQDGTAVESDSPYYHNNAEYYSSQAAQSAQDAAGSANDAQGYAGQAQSVAQTYGMHGTVVTGNDYKLYVGATN